MGVTEKQLKRYSARVRRRRRLRRLVLLSMMLLAFFLLVDRNFRPLVFSLAEARSAAMATRALNGALTEALEDGVAYDDLMNVRMDDGGQVSLLSANTMRMNALADRAGDAALRKLEAVSAQKVYVPLGAALGLTLFAGSGPRIPISIVPVGSVQSRLPRLYKLLFSFTHHSIQERYPFLAELFRPSFYVYVLLFIVLDGRCQRRRRLALATCPLWGLFATLLFSAGVFVRYAYPMMAAVPPLLMLTLFSDSQN